MDVIYPYAKSMAVFDCPDNIGHAQEYIPCGPQNAAGICTGVNRTQIGDHNFGTYAINGEDAAHEFVWTVPAEDNGQSAIRSGIVSFCVAHEYAFPASLLHNGVNHITFHIPSGENLQYDALRLELPGRG